MSRHTRSVQLSLILSLAGGCGAAPASTRELATSGTATERCVLRGQADALLLTVDGLPDLLSVYDLPAEVTLDGERAHARVLRPLLFAGTAETGAVRAHVGQPTSGPIALHRGAALRSLRVMGSGSLEATAVLSGPDEVDADYWRGVAVRTELGCGVVALGTASERSEADEPRAPGRVLLGDQDLALRAAPEGPVVGVLRIALEEAEERRMIEVLEERGELSRVRRGYPGGTIDAWVETARIGPAPMGLGSVSTMGHGSGTGCGRSDHPYSYRGPARVRAGTEVRAEATDRVWAVVSEELEAEVGVRPSGEVEIIAVEGLRSQQCGNLQFDLAMVPASAVRLP